jgi:predicted CopG family antitoxin
MKTIALDERTFRLLEELKRRKKASSFNEVVLEMIAEENEVPDSLFGSLKGKTGGFSPKERKNIWKDKYRE